MYNMGYTFSIVPEEFTAVWIPLIVDGKLQDTTEMERQPAESKDQNQTEHCLGHLSSLNKHKHTSIRVTDCTDRFGLDRPMKCKMFYLKMYFHK